MDCKLFKYKLLWNKWLEGFLAVIVQAARRDMWRG